MTAANSNNTIPVLMIPLNRYTTAKHQLINIKNTLSSTLGYDPLCSVHSVPSGGTLCRVECNSHEHVALLYFFNTFEGSYRL